MMIEDAKDIATKIIELIDSKTLLGAAYDCMSPVAQGKFLCDIADIIRHGVEPVRSRHDLDQTIGGMAGTPGY